MAEANKTASVPRWLHVLVIGQRPRWTLVRLAILIFSAIVVFGFILLPIRVTGISMSPTFSDGSINFVNRLAYLHQEPQRGDIVCIRYSGIHLMLAKRIIALPGETIAFQNGTLLINGEPLPEPYVKKPGRWNRLPMQLGPNEYYVVGDNRSMPFHLHEQGAADRRRIVGRLLLHGNA